MPSKIFPAIDHLVVRPVRDLVDITGLLITNPAYIARKLVAPDGSHLITAITYFAGAFSAAIVLNKIATGALGIETIQDAPYWALHAATVLAIALIAALLSLPFRPSEPIMFLKAACFAYGAGFLVAGFLVAGASLTLIGLRRVAYIPDFQIDLAAFQNFQVTGMHAYFQCLRQESVLFNALYNGFGGSFDSLSYPIDGLSYVQPALFVAASFLFVVLAFIAADRRRWAAPIIAGLSSSAIISGLIFEMSVLDSHLYATTSCSNYSVAAARDTTAEDQVRRLAEMHVRDIGHDNGPLVLTSVEAENRTLVLRYQISEHAVTATSFGLWLQNFRSRKLAEYCTPDNNFRQLGISHIWVFRRGDTEKTETVVQSADQCRR